jgi:hypothetical protein
MSWHQELKKKDIQQPSPLCFLLPYERWFVARAPAAPPAKQSDSVAKARIRYGKDGMRFYAATLINTGFGIVVSLLVPVLLLAGLAWSPLARAVPWVLVGGVLFFAVGLARASNLRYSAGDTAEADPASRENDTENITGCCLDTARIQALPNFSAAQCLREKALSPDLRPYLMRRIWPAEARGKAVKGTPRVFGISARHSVKANSGRNNCWRECKCERGRVSAGKSEYAYSSLRNRRGCSPSSQAHGC